LQSYIFISFFKNISAKFHNISIFLGCLQRLFLVQSLSHNNLFYE